MGLRVREMGSIVMAAAAGTSAWLNAGGVANRSRGIAAALTDSGAAGDTVVNAGATTGWDTLVSAMLHTPRVTLGGSDLASPGIVHTTDIAKQVTMVQEQAGGAASIRADVNVDLAVLDYDRPDRGYSILAAGSIAFPAGVPTAVWQSSRMAAPTDGGVGLTNLNLGADRGADALECVVLVTERGALAASGLSGFGLTHTSDIAKNVSSVREAAVGGASVLADIAFDYVILGLVPGMGDPMLELHALCSISAAGGVAGITGQSGHFASIARTGAGDYNLTLGADQGADANNSSIIACPRGVAAASTMRAIAVAHTSDTVKRITCLAEAGAGAASAAADLDFDLAIFRRLG